MRTSKGLAVAYPQLANGYQHWSNSWIFGMELGERSGLSNVIETPPKQPFSPGN